MQIIDFIKHFSFFVLFYLGCALVFMVIGVIWIVDRVLGGWKK